MSLRVESASAQQAVDELTITCTASHKILVGKRVTEKGVTKWETKRDVTEECIKAVWAWIYNTPEQAIVIKTPEGRMYSLKFEMETIFR